MTKSELLTRALTRPPFPGTRKLSVGIFALARELGLQAFLDPTKQQPLTVNESAIQTAALCWLLDASVPLAEIRAEMMHGREHVLGTIIPPYADRISPVLMVQAQREFRLTNEELGAVEYDIEPKPSETDTKEKPAGK